MRIAIMALAIVLFGASPVKSQVPPCPSCLCITWVNFSGTISACNVNLTWQFNQIVDGTFQIEYSTDGSTFYQIGSVQSGPANYQYQTYNFTDPNGCPSTPGMTYYRIKFVTSTDCYFMSSIVAINRSSCSGCPTRCGSLPNRISILGEAGICDSTTQQYVLSPAYPALWSVTPSQFTTTSGPGPSTGISITNTTSSTNSITVSANIYGCRTVSRTITLLPCPVACPSMNALSVYNEFGPSTYWCSNAALNGFTLHWDNNFYGTAKVEIFEHNGLSNPPIFTQYGVSGGENLQAPLLPPANGWYRILATNDCNPQNTAGLIVEAKYCDYGRPATVVPTTTVFPNPAKNVLYVSLTQGEMPPTNEVITFQLYNMFSGQLMQTWKANGGLAQHKLDIAGQKKGQYMLKITRGKESITKAVILQ
jgi:hypothetical protein